MNKNFLFEVSWEVCNKVGGINTVLRTKLEQARENFPTNYILIGPLLSNNDEFIEDQSKISTEIRELLSKKNIRCRIGYWNIEPKPTVILVEYKDKYDMNQLLSQLWKDFNVDSYQTSYEDYIQFVLFGTIAAEVIEIFSNELQKIQIKTIAQFHEWQSSSGILYLKKHAPKISTVFTTHATTLGRLLAEQGNNIYNLSPDFSPEKEAQTHHITHKHSLECASAKTADCFTSVSSVVADECHIMLGSYPDKLTFNGINTETARNYINTLDREANRKKIIEVASTLTDLQFEKDTLIWITSGRYELHNKGYDILVKSLKKINYTLRKQKNSKIIFMFLIAQQFSNENDVLLNSPTKEHQNILTHRLHQSDDFLKLLLQEFGPQNPDNHIQILYCPSYLNGHDGVFNISYADMLAAVDLSIFPSFYEPWGYTPLESLAYETPTITSNLSGFGTWVSDLVNIENCSDSVYVLEYRNTLEPYVIELLCKQLEKVSTFDEERRAEIKGHTTTIAKMADWHVFYQNYLDAYQQAFEINEEFNTGVAFKGKKAAVPIFHTYDQKINLIKPFNELKDLAQNLWWSWNLDAETLFKELNAELWNKTKQNPIVLLKSISMKTLVEKRKDRQYLKKYRNVQKRFNTYITTNPTNQWAHESLINIQHPIAYFCLEYGLAPCLPIYSGGLGILAGDYLKTISDLNIPMISIGLFYREGYFRQTVNHEGEQIDWFEPKDPSNLPIELILNESGKPVVLSIRILDKEVNFQIWRVKVGRIDLYLLDTDVPTNPQPIRQITHRLYVGSREERIMQELVLGVGGIRFIHDHLEITPALYHMNEGHSAFLIFELMKHYFKQGHPLDEAKEIVKSFTIFTTHTTVPAGNEAYTKPLIEKHLLPFANELNTTTDELFALGQDLNQSPNLFSMTAFAMRFSIYINAVSKMHEQVAQVMWAHLWPGFLVSETPITSVTNGIHIETWLGSHIKSVYHKYLSKNWYLPKYAEKIWKKVSKIPLPAIYEAHLKQKEALFASIKERIIDEYCRRNESMQLINSSLDCLNNNPLCIGLSRRFASYKRHALILKDKEKFAKLLTDEQRPMILFVAGKAHPSDPSGKALIKEFMDAIRDPIFKGRIILIENYNMEIAKLLVEGVDIWLNTPILNTEACGTSGMKAGINGVQNLSIKDGWWNESYCPEIGFQIKSNPDVEDQRQRDETEELFLLNTLENEIIPLYYQKPYGANQKWLTQMRTAMQLITKQFGTYRMVKEYFEKFYKPISLYSSNLLKHNSKKLKELVAWKKTISDRFKTISIKTTSINGIDHHRKKTDKRVRIKLLLHPGQCSLDEIKAEFIFTQKGLKDINEIVQSIPLICNNKAEGENFVFTGNCDISKIAFDAYGIRIYPYHPLLLHPQDTGITYWL